jgi:stage 0 sporulation protein B (sporulation initiation phosphotransferase)
LEEQKVVDIIRRMRHDFGNYLQVIGGYLELDKKEQAQYYIREIAGRMAQERIIFELLPADQALYFYQQVLLARELGVILVYEDFDIKSLAVLEAYQEPGNTLKKLADGINKENDVVIALSLYEDENGIELLFKSDTFRDGPVRLRLNRE